VHALRADVLGFLFQSANAAANAPAVHFELCFAGTSGADSAAQARHLRPVSRQARQEVVELREFHLQLTFPGAGVPGENIQNDLGAIDDTAVSRAFNVALLCGGEFTIEDEQVGSCACRQLPNFIQLAAADERGGIQPLARLENPVLDRGAGALGEFL